MKKVKQIFHFKPFSKKQRKVLNWWCDASPVKDKDGIIADGAIRSGKTICMSLSFAIWAMERFNGQNFAMCGKTIGSFRRNVLFWLIGMNHPGILLLCFVVTLIGIGFSVAAAALSHLIRKAADLQDQSDWTI